VSIDDEEIQAKTTKTGHLTGIKRGTGMKYVFYLVTKLISLAKQI